MTKSQVMKFHNDSFNLEYVMVDGNPWLKGREVALMLKYQNIAKSIQDHVGDDDNVKFGTLLKKKMCFYGRDITKREVLIGTRKIPFMSMSLVYTV